MTAAAKRKSRSKPKNQCSTPSCTKAATTCGMCPACYAYDYYWTRLKNAAERRHHQDNLALRQERMEQLRPARLRSVK